MIDPRFDQDAGRQVFTCGELLVKGALETEGGVHLLVRCPSWPLAGFRDAVVRAAPLLADSGVVVQSVNAQAGAMAMVHGAQLAGCRAVAVVGAAGLLAVGDALTRGVQAGTRGDSGALIVCGDDPGGDPTQADTDPRVLAEQVGMPLVEPWGPQQIKDWVGLALSLGRACQTYVGYLVPAPMARGGGTVLCRPNHAPLVNPPPPAPAAARARR